MPGISGVDTRRLTRHLRDHGAMPCAFGTAGPAELLAAAEAAPSTEGRDLVSTVTTPTVVTRGTGPYRVVAYDFGIKEAMLRQLGDLATVDRGARLDPGRRGPRPGARRRLPVQRTGRPGRPAGDRRRDPHPGRGGPVPVFGICLGHQLLATALGATTYKLPFGHHGGNHPVRRIATGRVEITSQNHNYAVAEDSLASSEVTHVNLNDGVIEGIRSRDTPVFSVQYHPEAGPGPHDARYLFDEFRSLMDATGARAARAREVG